MNTGKKKNKKISVIIAAAGNASRLGREEVISKQFLLLDGKPLLFHSIEKFLALENIIEIVVVTNNVYMTNDLLGKTNYLKNREIKTVDGGERRQDSVYNGFLSVDKNTDLVLIHDVARPLVLLSDIKRSIDAGLQYGAATLASPVVDTIKLGKYDKDELFVEKTLERNNLYSIQTPQVFAYELLFNTYSFFAGKMPVITDEASLIEQYGKSVNLVISKGPNLKITYESDLLTTGEVLKNQV